jgi:ribosomal protein S18 acetylase RimI-like enzyme
MAPPAFTLRPMTDADRAWVRGAMVRDWGSETMAVHGMVYRPADLPGLVAEVQGEAIGLLTYHLEAQVCEIVTLNSWRQGLGVGAALLEAARQAAGREGCRRVWLVTTNDNTRALRFYQKHGFVIAAVHINAIEKDRRLKPEIPLTGMDGIPIRDEIELELWLE